MYEWYSRFKGGEMSCEDQPRYGRHSTCRNDENLDKVRNAINADEISEITGLSWISCQRMLTEDLNIKRLSAKFVPRLLTEDQKNNRLNEQIQLFWGPPSYATDQRFGLRTGNKKASKNRMAFSVACI